MLDPTDYWTYKKDSLHVFERYAGHAHEPEALAYLNTVDEDDLRDALALASPQTHGTVLTRVVWIVRRRRPYASLTEFDHFKNFGRQSARALLALLRARGLTAVADAYCPHCKRPYTESDT